VHKNADFQGKQNSQAVITPATSERSALTPCDGHHEMSDLGAEVNPFTMAPKVLSQRGRTSDWMIHSPV
jgi:hypothetical protein